MDAVELAWLEIAERPAQQVPPVKVQSTHAALFAAVELEHQFGGVIEAEGLGQERPELQVRAVIDGHRGGCLKGDGAGTAHSQPDG